ncbi:MAG TPA: VOC family protein [Verrucomicrobiae bacterium]|nr:VOC family protein [Verrucomicrobiae bacterium]
MNPFDKPLEEFLTRLFHLLDEAGVDVSNLEMDHVCYRVETLERYLALAHAWRLYAVDVHESPVNGRPISVFVLRRPLRRAGRAISVIELPAPKEGVSFREGWEHAEFVIEGPTFNHFIARHRHLAERFDRKSVNKSLNPELGLKLDHGIQAKFHFLPLAKVIELERQHATHH